MSSRIIDILIKLHFYSFFDLIFDADQEEKSVLTLNFELNLSFWGMSLFNYSSQTLVTWYSSVLLPAP